MKKLNAITVASLVLMCGIASSLFAQSTGPDQNDDGKGLMQRGFEMLFDGMQQEGGPDLDEALELLRGVGPSLQSFLQEMGPALADMADDVRDWSIYELPEILPNGDILIRRKPPQDDVPAQDMEQDDLGGVEI